MTTYYVDSAGSNTAPYDTWAKAANLLATIAAIDVAGDTVYVASTHSESTGSNLTLAWAGTATAPTQIISADKTSGAPPATVLAGASVAVTGFTLTITGTAYIYGLVTQSSTTGTNTTGLSLGADILWESCSFVLTGASGSGAIITGSFSRWLNCSVKFGATGQSIIGTNTAGTYPKLFWSGGSLSSGGTSPTSLIKSGGASSPVGVIENIDLSVASSPINLVSSTASPSILAFRNIKLPSSWSGSLNASAAGLGAVFTLYNCDSAGTNYILHRQTQFGDVYSETTIVRSGGASDGTTPLSWKMVSLAASGTFPITALQTGEFTSRNNNISAPVTVTVEFVHDSLTGLKDNEIWLEVDYYASSGNPQGTLASSAMANVLATPATLTASSAIWTTTGLTNPNTQKMSVTFTPNLKGSFLATVKLAKSAYTVYVDPKMTLTF